jgi:integrase
MTTPAAANTMIKTMRQPFRFAVRYDLHDTNPAAQVEYLNTNAEGFHSWTLDEIEAYEKAQPFGSMARLALALALYTGQRRSDLVRFGWKDVREDEGVSFGSASPSTRVAIATRLRWRSLSSPKALPRG